MMIYGVDLVSLTYSRSRHVITPDHPRIKLRYLLALFCVLLPTKLGSGQCTHVFKSEY